MHDNALDAIQQFTEAVNGQYLWQPGLQMGLPSTILGRPWVLNQNMDSDVTAAGDIVLCFGDLSKYMIREVMGVTLRRTDELFLANNQTGFFIFWRGDGDLLDAGTEPVQVLTIKA